jgi:hypothetical protein
MFPRDMVCLRNISVDTLHKGYTEDNNNNNNNNNNNFRVPLGRVSLEHLVATADRSHLLSNCNWSSFLLLPARQCVSSHCNRISSQFKASWLVEVTSVFVWLTAGFVYLPAGVCRKVRTVCSNSKMSEWKSENRQCSVRRRSQPACLIDPTVKLCCLGRS